MAGGGLSGEGLGNDHSELGHEPGDDQLATATADRGQILLLDAVHVAPNSDLVKKCLSEGRVGLVLAPQRLEHTANCTGTLTTNTPPLLDLSSHTKEELKMDTLFLVVASWAPCARFATLITRTAR